MYSQFTCTSIVPMHAFLNCNGSGLIQSSSPGMIEHSASVQKVPSSNLVPVRYNFPPLLHPGHGTKCNTSGKIQRTRLKIQTRGPFNH